jgi:hypothetical protein
VTRSNAVNLDFRDATNAWGAMELKISITPGEAKKIIFWLIGLEMIFVLLYLVTHVFWADLPWGPVRTLFNLDGDLSIPAWFSSIQLFMTGSVLLVASLNNRHKHRMPTALLVAGGMLFIFLSADEGAAIHEKLTDVARTLEMDWLLFRGDHGAWIAVYAVMFLMIAAFGARYLITVWKNFRRESLLALSGAVTLVAGGVGLEILGYLMFSQQGKKPFMYKVEVACEEMLEMAGVSIILYAVLLLCTAVTSAPAAAELDEAP